MKLLARLLVCSCFVSPLGAQATTWIVDPGGPLNSIQAAIDLAQPGDLVQVLPGYYYERLQLKSGVSVQATPGTVTVEAESEGPAITAVGVGTTTAVTGLTLQHGSSDQGGGLYALASSPSFVDCTFNANSAILGGGAYLDNGSQASFTRCRFSSNLATVGGGIYLDFSVARLDACTITDNEASDGGGLSASNAAEAVLTYTSIYGNLSRLGSTVACNLASPSFTNCTVASNQDALGTFALRGSGTRIVRSIVAFNAGPALLCEGFSSPWVDCSIFFGNLSDQICAGDQGTNLFVNPLFCDPVQDNYDLSANSPATGGSCGTIGAHPVTCPARGVETALQPSSWTHLKGLYR